MSIDLSRPPVPSGGQHDPLEGFITLSALAAGGPPGSEAGEGALERLLRELRELSRVMLATSPAPAGYLGS